MPPPIEPLLPLLLGQALDGIAQRRGGNGVNVALQEVAQQVLAHAFSHFTKHPSHGFVHQVVRVGQVLLSVAEALPWVTLVRGCPGTHHADALPPQVVAAGQGIEHCDFVLKLQAGSTSPQCRWER